MGENEFDKRAREAERRVQEAMTACKELGEVIARELEGEFGVPFWVALGWYDSGLNDINLWPEKPLTSDNPWEDGTSERIYQLQCRFEERLDNLGVEEIWLTFHSQPRRSGTGERR